MFGLSIFELFINLSAYVFAFLVPFSLLGQTDTYKQPLLPSLPAGLLGET